jgi:hypothetical protein
MMARLALACALLVAAPASAQVKIAGASASASADAVVDRLDAGSGPGTLVIFGSACPDDADDADAGTTLAVLTFSDPAFGAASGGTATANTITADTSANATGTAMCFRAKDSDGNVVFQGTITTAGSGGDLILSSTSITSGQSVAISALTYTQPEEADVIAAASCAEADVQTAVDSAEAGDTVLIPAGTCSWTTALVWTAPANVTLAGSGSAVQGGGDTTVITDNYASGNPLMNITVASTGTFRLAGLTVQGGSGSLKESGIIKINGPGTVRLDHLHVDMTSYSPHVVSKMLWIGGGIRGVVHNSIFDQYGLTWMHIVNGTDANGDIEWSTATAFGTNDFFFIEDNEINGTTGGATYDSALTDCVSGGKFVARFNTMVASVISQTHPTGHSPGDDRGCRAHEAYANLVTSPLTANPNFAMDYNNSGAGLTWGNSIDQVYKNIFYFNNCRTDSVICSYGQNTPPAGWGYCNGTSVWDTNGSPNVCIDQPGRGQGDLLVGSYLTSNRLNDATGTQTWPNQALEPIYEWSTTGDIVAGWGGNWVSNLVPTMIAANRDYYLHHGNTGCDAGAGSCTTGVGVGTLANRPSNCTTGVAYFATDQGSWNTTSTNTYGVQRSGADGVLYKCTATNTWTSYYTPYTYPHALR